MVLESAVSWPSLLVLVIVLALLLNLPRAILRYHRRLKLLRAIPCSFGLPPNPWYWLLGHIPVIYKQDEELLLRSMEAMNKPENWQDRLSIVWVGPAIPMLVVSHSGLLEELLKEPKSRLVYNMLIPWLGEGLLVSEGKRWFRSRRLLTPAFHFEILKGYVPVYNNCVSILLDKWSKSASKNEPVLLFDSFSAMSFDVILRCAFSFKSDCQIGQVKHPYVTACCELVHQCTDRIMNPLNMIDWLYWMTPQGKKTKRLCNIVHQHAERVIAQRRVDLQNVTRGDTSAADLQKEVTKTRKYLDFLDILLTAVDDEGKGMSDLHVRNEVDTFMFEGHDTTTSAMSWTLYLLAQHPEHQDKVRQEVRGVLMGREWLEYDDLKELKYTTWCVKEAMRLYPPVFYFFRKTTEELELNNLLIPKDSIIVVGTVLIHRNVQIWEKPNEFDPLRFRPENIEKQSPYDYIPFSAGNRNCIGQNFAMNEMKLVIGTIVNRFLVKVDKLHKVEMVPRVVLRTKYDIKVLLEPAP